MPYQSAVTIQAPLPAAAVIAAGDRLAALQQAVEQGQSAFDATPDVHFARFTLLPATTLPDGTHVGDSVLYLADVDGSRRRHLRALARNEALCTAGFGQCTGFPTGGTVRARTRWLAAHRIPCAAAYVNTVGRGSRQIVDEARLRERLEARVDELVASGAAGSAADVDRQLRAAVAADPALGFARAPAAPPPLWWRAASALSLAANAVLLLALAPALLLGLPAFLVLLRRHERADVPDTARPDAATVEALRAQEDRFAYNPFSAVGSVKPGPFRRFTLRLVLRGISLATRHVFTRGSLAGVRTIHFARWVYLDDRRRVIFASYYDGSLENYMDDFIDRVAWGLNAVFSNGQGYPRTRWLVLEGARREDDFKNHLRTHQLPTQVSYCPYAALSTANIERNAEIRAGFSASRDEGREPAWLSLL